jgi:hypothetical protein
MGRSLLYSLISEGKIRSVTVRLKTNKGGMRLVYRPSVSAFLASLSPAQANVQRGEK